MNLKAEQISDLIPYDTQAQRLAHPDKLSVIAKLSGIESCKASNAKILEIGCGNGNNLISIAYLYPKSHCLGVDISSKSITSGSEKISALGLSNIQLKCLNILDISKDLGSFDYIICHGIFSWVPENVRNKILQIFSSQLSENGIGFLSYNTYPGWHTRGIARDILKFSSKTKKTLPESKLAIAEIIELLKRGPAASRPELLSELTTAYQQPDWYLAHDYLAEENRPYYLYEFVDLLGQNGLQYLAEAEMPKMLSADLTPEAQKVLLTVSRDWLTRNQYLDFYRNTMFRRSLICKAGLNIQRTLDEKQIDNFKIASQMKTSISESDLKNQVRINFKNPNGGALEIPDRTMAMAMMVLSRTWPSAMSLNELVSACNNKLSMAGIFESIDVSKLRNLLLKSYAADLVEFYLTPPALSTDIADRPIASKLARIEALSSAQVTTLRHELIKLNEKELNLIKQLDGSKSKQELQQEKETLNSLNGLALLHK